MCTDKVRGLFGVGICSLILGCMVIATQSIVFGFRAQRSRGLEIGLLTTGGLTGLTLILAGIFNLWKSFSIRQFALFDQPGGRKSVRSAALILVGLNGVSSCASISLATVSSLLAKQFYLPDQFEIVVRPDGTIQESDIENVFHGAVGMVISSIIATSLSGTAVAMAVYIYRHPLRTLAAVAGVPYESDSRRNSAGVERSPSPAHFQP